MPAPTPHELGLSSDSETTWEGIGIAEPTPGDLFGADMSWEEFDRLTGPEAEAGL